jgi:3',5'-cyclic AMP phosphodiesterase CpdA
MQEKDWQLLDRTVLQREGKEEKLLRYDFSPERFRRVEIVHLTDLQIGSKNFLRKRFEEYCAWILSRPYRFIVLGGDIVDAATVLSVAMPHDNTGEPIDQIEEATELLQPLHRRVLGYVGGNHERRTIKTFGDCGRLIAGNLEVPYSRGVQLIDVHFGDHHPFKISLWHGIGGAGTKGTLAQKLHRFMGKGDSHAYFMGHHHHAIILPDYRQQRQGNRIKLQKIMGIASSSFQGYWNGYAEVAGLSPFDVMMGRVILEPDGKWEVTLR